MSSNKQQTAVDIAFEKLANQGLLITRDYKNLRAYREAKEMEKERMINFTEDWYFNGFPLEGGGGDVEETIEQYYNETYGGNK
jgi:hypothetical protein